MTVSGLQEQQAVLSPAQQARIAASVGVLADVVESLAEAFTERTRLLTLLQEQTARGEAPDPSTVRRIGDATIYIGDCLQSLKAMPDGCVQTCVTSPPYFGLRDYGVDGQLGLEQTPDEFVAALVAVFSEVKRVLRDDGTLWLNLGDSYGAGKQLLGTPWRTALALQADGWVLRQDIIWHKPNPMPESVRDRCTKAHEYIFLLSKSDRYFFDAAAIKEASVSDDRRPSALKRSRAFGYTTKDKTIKGYADKPNEVSRTDTAPDTRNKRSVWTVTTKPYKGAHFATFPQALIEPCILAGAPVGGVVLDPFLGSGTTAAVALKHGRKAVGLELNPEYVDLAVQRIAASSADA